MKLVFSGTRGNIEARNRRHYRHTSLMVSYCGRKVMIDCGEDWYDRFRDLKPRAIVVTHAHPDHVFGLRDGAPCPVYATPEAWESMQEFAIEERRVVEHRGPVEIEGIRFESFPLEHSTRAPAVGYRVQAGTVVIFYAPDVAWIKSREEVLAGAQAYIGDGATIRRTMVRKIDDSLVGHAPIQTQLTWCQKEDVPRAFFTHCGSQIVEGDERSIGPEIRRMGEERGVEAEIAHDGMEVALP